MKEKPIAKFKPSFKRLYLVVMAWTIPGFLLIVIADAVDCGVENMHFSGTLIAILVIIIGMGLDWL